MTLEKIRKELDAVDKKLITLLEKRSDLIDRIAKVKARKGLKIEHKGREEEILLKISKIAGKKSKEFISDVYKVLFKISKKRQKEVYSKS